MSRIAIDLYQHTETKDALLLSASGNPRDAQWLPRKFATQVLPGTISKTRSFPLTRARFEIDDRKLKELGWLQSDDKRQGSLVL